MDILLPSVHVHRPSIMTELEAESVTAYLHDNQEFLDKYISSHVSQEQLEKWLQRKTNHKQQRLKNGDRTGGSVYTSEVKSSNNNENSGISKWKFTMHEDKRKVLHDLTKDIHQQTNKNNVLNELVCCAASAIRADGYSIYQVDDAGKEIYYYCHGEESSRSTSCHVRDVGAGSTVAAYVAATREPLRLNDTLTGEAYPEGVPSSLAGDNIQAVLAQPVMQADGSVIAVVELYREKGGAGFTADEEEVSANILFLCDLCIRCHEMYHNMTKQRKLNEFLLTVTKSIFQDIVSMDTVIMKIMNFAKKLVNADRTALFLLDNRTKELYARVFDMGEEYDDHADTSPHTQKEIRFPMDKGVAGHVASTGEILNIPDAYADDRFNRNVDLQTGYRTKTILCMPIYIRGSIIGVVQMVNKMNGVFTQADEEAFETFAIYCGLALHHAKLYDKIRRSEQKYKVALEVLSYHSMAHDNEVDEYMNVTIPPDLPEVTSYEYSPWAVPNEQKPGYVIYMFKDLFNMTRFDEHNLYKFTLTVKRNYRNVPYHNWAHAFSVAHAMYTVIKTSSNNFSPLEGLALFVASLCHDIDHRGKTNAFMVKSASPLAGIYSTSTMEHHHFNQTVAILQHDGHNIFKHLTSEEYKQVLGDIKHCILATDLALFFGNRARLKDLTEKEKFTWEAKDHRDMMMAISMTASDLCSMYKPWDLQLQLVHIIMEEFWQQGDEEKAAGSEPIPMMDRDKRDQLPQSQVGFLVGICLPCYELLAEIMPATKPMVDGAKANLKRWKEMAEQQKEAEERRKLAAIEEKKNKDKPDTREAATEDTLNNSLEDRDKSQTESKEETVGEDQVLQPEKDDRLQQIM